MPSTTDSRYSFNASPGGLEKNGVAKSSVAKDVTQNGDLDNG